MMNVITAHCYVDCSVHLNARNFSSTLFHHVIDMMNMVVLDYAEYTAHTTDNTALFAVMNIITANNMSTDVFL